MDTTPHLDLATTATGLEELVVIAAAGGAAAATTNRQYGADAANAGRRNASQWPPVSHSNDAGGGASGHAPVCTRRSALDRALAALPGLRRLRLAGADASAARLGSAMMGLTGLSSLRLQHCRLPTFLGTGEGQGGRAGGGGGTGAGAAAGGSGSGGRGATAFGRQMVHNLGAKLLVRAGAGHLASKPARCCRAEGPHLLAAQTHLLPSRQPRSLPFQGWSLQDYTWHHTSQP